MDKELAREIRSELRSLPRDRLVYVKGTGDVFYEIDRKELQQGLAQEAPVKGILKKKSEI
jgi:hypothetical protein